MKIMKTIISTIIFFLSTLSLSAQEFYCIKTVYKLGGAIYNEKHLAKNSNISISEEKIVITTTAQSNSWENNDTVPKPTKITEWKLLKLTETSNSKNGKLDFGEEILVKDSDNESWKGYLYKKGDTSYFVLQNLLISSEIWYELNSK